jgi:hypothetical protein
MIEFKKENGFPVYLRIISEEIIEKDFIGFISKIINKKGKVIKEFYHKDLRARIHWADGYFSALKRIK